MEERYFPKIILIIIIAFLTSITLSRGIYLYQKSKYQQLDDIKRPSDEATELRKQLRLTYFKISLAVSIILLLVGYSIENKVLSYGLMTGALFKILGASFTSWSYLEESEKFTLSSLSLAAVIGYVIYGKKIDLN